MECIKMDESKAVYVGELKRWCKVESGRLMESLDNRKWNQMCLVGIKDLNIINEYLETKLDIKDVRKAALESKAHILVNLLQGVKGESDLH